MMQRLHAKLLLLLLLAGLASGYYIETYNETYYCEDPIVVCVPPHFNFSENCKEEWTKLPMKIAIASSANSSKPQCHPHVCVYLAESSFSVNTHKWSLSLLVLTIMRFMRKEFFFLVFIIFH